jgi:hypothetical protein
VKRICRRGKKRLTESEAYLQKAIYETGLVVGAQAWLSDSIALSAIAAPACNRRTSTICGADGA